MEESLYPNKPTDIVPPNVPHSLEVEGAVRRSRGEKIFDWVTYGGVAGVGTFVATVPLTYSLLHGKAQPLYDWATRGMERLFKLVGRDTAGAKRAALTTALMMGGNAMLLPVGLLEKHKVGIVDSLNQSVGDPMPREQIEKSPKQTWGSLIASRLVAWGCVFTSFTIAGKFFAKTFDTFEHETGELFCKIMRKPKEQMVAGVLQKTKPYLYGRIGALDVFATIGAATLLYIGGHFFARKHEEKLERRAARKHGHALSADDAAMVSEATAETGASKPEPVVTKARQHEGTAVASAMAMEGHR